MAENLNAKQEVHAIKKDEEESKEKNQMEDLSEKSNKMKKEHSYTYWVNNDPNFFKDVKINTNPQKIDPQFKRLQKQESIHSAWNQSGTWYIYSPCIFFKLQLREEKAIKVEIIQNQLEKDLKGQSLSNKYPFIIFENIKEVSGESHLVLVRGKKKLGYHLQIIINFQEKDTKNNKEVRFKFNEFSDDGDREYKIQNDDESQSETYQALKASIQCIEEKIVNSLNNLKEII